MKTIPAKNIDINYQQILAHFKLKYTNVFCNLYQTYVKVGASKICNKYSPVFLFIKKNSCYMSQIIFLHIEVPMIENPFINLWSFGLEIGIDILDNFVSKLSKFQALRCYSTSLQVLSEILTFKVQFNENQRVNKIFGNRFFQI